MRLPLIAALCLLAACSGDEAGLAGEGGGGKAAAAGASAGRAAAGQGGSSGWSSDPGLAGTTSKPEDNGADGGSAMQTCAKQTARATRQPVYLVFAFDVSGSMGKGDKPWHDRKLKWEPVVAATKSFFEDAKSEGYSASLTFFPADDDRCDKASYLTPDVPMQALPSKQFGEALDAIGKEDWRGGTPTLFVIQGVFDQIDNSQKAHPGRYALVLVTDGYPQDCDDDSIATVAELVKTRAADIPTYVIGVTNPPIKDAPDVTTNLADIAKAGGTSKAYLIDTGNPTQTTADLKRTVDEIRSAAISCELAIPQAPAGQTFDKQKVSVRYTSGGSKSSLKYDADCKANTSWHYDDVKAPKEIVLCPDTCKVLQGDESAELAVDFECEPVILL
ncbi:MAG TPA: vWA domain-containing protein [Polyangiales bacterium]|nr:vWA domain-containing protein [Polyangiales bacterium]